jgi:hypothetical protein
MGDPMSKDYLAKAKAAHGDAVAAAWAFEANPTAETAFTAYRAAREALGWGSAAEIGGNGCNCFEVFNETFALRAEALATPDRGYAAKDTIVLRIAGHKLVTLLNLLEADLRTRMESFKECNQSIPDALVEMLNWVDTIRDTLSGQRNTRRDREAGVTG